MLNPQQTDITGLTGQVERITYNNEENGYTVALVKVIGRKHRVTVVGDLMAPAPGTILELQGHWTDHPKFGPQFKVVHWRAQVPVTKRGIEKYLGSGMIKNIGPETAKRIVRQFGKRTLDIIEQEPEQLSKVPGIGAKRATAIQSAWQEHKGTRDIMLFLQSHGVGTAHALKIIRQYGQQTVTVVQQNPYQLASDVFGIGFQTADQIADQLGIDKSFPLRIRAGILHVLNQMADDGHLYMTYEQLIDRCQMMLESDRDIIITAIADLDVNKQIVIEDLNPEFEKSTVNHKAVYQTKFYRYETFVARHLHKLLQAPLYQGVIDTRPALNWVQQKFRLKLAQGQQEAVIAALTRKVLVITGGPGTGKTTIIQAITLLYEHLRARVLLAAPTGRAAKRLSEATGRPAKTIHRLLAYHPKEGGFQKNETDPLEGDLLVIDEASMIDAVLMYYLMKAVPLTTTVILVGDVNQLPSVGPGNVLKDILSSQKVPQVVLCEIFRQARDSRIVINAHKINAGHLPDLSKPPGDILSDFYFVEQADPDKALDTILTLVSDRIPERFGFDPVDEIQVMSPMYRGVVGAENLNQKLQQVLNPQEAYVGRGEQRFGLKDKVMQIRNNYEKDVFNGDIGRIHHIDPRDKKVVIRFDDRLVDYEFENLDEVVLAYAITVHKSQGSEYPAVIIPVTTAHYLLLQRNLIYTGITRAKKLVVLVGTRRAMAMAIKNNAPQKRNTRLAFRLSHLVGEASVRPQMRYLDRVLGGR